MIMLETITREEAIFQMLFVSWVESVFSQASISGACNSGLRLKGNLADCQSNSAASGLFASHVNNNLLNTVIGHGNRTDSL